MRKILLPFAMTGLLSMPLVGCDVEDGDTDTDTTAPNDVGDTTQPDDTDTVTPATYTAIIVDDSEIFPTHRTVGSDPCATSGFNNGGDGAHGADIDAVGLYESDGTTLVGFYDVVDGALGTACDNKPNTTPNRFTDINQAKGAPNATLSSGFVSLSGGAIVGEFDGGVELFAGDVVIVYEVGAVQGGTTDAYDVFVADRLDCLTSGNRASCQKKVASVSKGETTVPLSGF